jgi:hypothetical protein
MSSIDSFGVYEQVLKEASCKLLSSMGSEYISNIDSKLLKTIFPQSRGV